MKLNALFWLTLIFAFYTSKLAAEPIANVSIDVESLENEFKYTYTVFNAIENSASGSPDNLFSFLVSIPTNVTVSSIVSPENWVSTYSSGASTVTWIAQSFDATLHPGETADFGFVSQFSPGETNYNASFISEPNGFPVLGENFGPTLGPVGVAIPEPSALIQSGLGIFGLACLGCWRYFGKELQVSAE